MTGSMRELHPALNVAAAHMLTIVAAHCHVKSDRVFSERGELKSSLKGGCTSLSKSARTWCCFQACCICKLLPGRETTMQGQTGSISPTSPCPALAVVVSAVSCRPRCRQHLSSRGPVPAGSHYRLGSQARRAHIRQFLCRPCCRAQRGPSHSTLCSSVCTFASLPQSFLMLCPSMLLLPCRPRCRALRGSWRLSASRPGSALLGNNICSARKGSGSAWRSR